MTFTRPELALESIISNVDLGIAVYLILSTYLTNATPLLLGGGKPVDGGRNFVDGRRIFGDNKTVRGFVSGIAVGLVVAVFLAFAVASWLFGFAVLASLGALVGDLAGAFVKRRLAIPAGGILPLVDQLDFVAGAVLLVSTLYNVPLASILLLVIVTPPIHLATNVAAHALRLKKTYW